MKAVTYCPKHDTFQVKTLPMPTLHPHDVLVRVEACGLNPVDAKIARWAEQVPEMTDTWVPGLDVSGYVEAVGDGVTLWKPGDRVLYHGDMFRPHGGFAEYATQHEAAIIPHPRLSAVEAAATPCAGWTAWRALVDKLKLSKNHSLFIAGGAGGVGGFAIQIAKYLQLETIITTCSAKNADYVRKLGATHVIDYGSENTVERIMEITNRQGVSRGLDCVGYDTDKDVAAALAFEGHMAELVDEIRSAEYDNAFMKGLSFHLLSLGSGHRNGPAAQEDLRNAGIVFSNLCQSHNIHIPVTQTISLEETGPALKEMLNQRTVGKIVLHI